MIHYYEMTRTRKLPAVVCAVFCEAHLRVMGANHTLIGWFRLQSESPMLNTYALGRDPHYVIHDCCQCPPTSSLTTLDDVSG